MVRSFSTVCRYWGRKQGWCVRIKLRSRGHDYSEVESIDNSSDVLQQLKCFDYPEMCHPRLSIPGVGEEFLFFIAYIPAFALDFSQGGKTPFISLYTFGATQNHVYSKNSNKLVEKNTTGLKIWIGNLGKVDPKGAVWMQSFLRQRRIIL